MHSTAHSHLLPRAFGHTCVTLLTVLCSARLHPRRHLRRVRCSPRFLNRRLFLALASTSSFYSCSAQLLAPPELRLQQRHPRRQRVSAGPFPFFLPVKIVVTPFFLASAVAPISTLRSCAGKTSKLRHRHSAPPVFCALPPQPASPCHFIPHTFNPKPVTLFSRLHTSSRCMYNHDDNLGCFQVKI